MSQGSLAISGNDGDRRMCVMRRRPERFVSMSVDQRQNFVMYGLTNRDGHLESKSLSWEQERCFPNE